MIASTLGKNILLLRRDRGMTQKALGDAVGLAPNTIARLERGVLEDLRSKKVIQIADIFDVTLDVLCGRDVRQKGSNDN